MSRRKEPGWASARANNVAATDPITLRDPGGSQPRPNSWGAAPGTLLREENRFLRITVRAHCSVARFREPRTIASTEAAKDESAIRGLAGFRI